jgi:hypothetical protein
MSQTESIQNRTKEEKAAILEEWEKSGLSKKEFCLQKNIRYQTFIWWFASLKRSQKDAATNKFIPISVEQDLKHTSTEVHLSNSRIVIFHGYVSAEILQAVLRC